MTKQERLDEFNKRIAAMCIQPRVWTEDDCSHAWQFSDERERFGIMKRREECVLCGSHRQIILREDGSIPYEGGR